jgi:hypothetical protein
MLVQDESKVIELIRMAERIIDKSSGFVEKADVINKRLIVLTAVSIIAFCITFITIAGFYFIGYNYQEGCVNNESIECNKEDTFQATETTTATETTEEVRGE